MTTLSLNKKTPTQLKFERRKAVLTAMYKIPVLREFKPLKIDIHKDLYELFPDYSHRQIRIFLNNHTSSDLYKISDNCQRFDLSYGDK